MSAIADDRKSDLPDAPPPAAFGRYEVLFPIARGGMAEVFAARIRGEGDFERYFAIKRMAQELIRHEKFVQSFLDEARLTACIHSPNVVQVVDIGRDERGAPYLVMELIQGVSLSALKKRIRQPLPLGVVCEIGAQAAAGLEDAHTACDARGEPLGVVHRDISPQNVLVAIDGRVRIADFGIARAKQRLASNTQSGELKGKFGYFAPEQLRGGADPRTDTFALGVVLWELMAGRHLFHTSEVLDTIMNVERMEIPRIDQVRPDIPADLADVIARALQRDPLDRFATAGQMSVAFRRLIDRGTLGPPPEPQLRALARTATAPLLATLQRAASGEHSLEDPRPSLAPTALAGSDGRPSLRTSQVPTDEHIPVEIDIEAPVSDVRPRPSESPTNPRAFVPITPSMKPIPATIGPGDRLLAPVVPPEAILTEPESTERLVRLSAPTPPAHRTPIRIGIALAVLGCIATALAGFIVFRLAQRPTALVTSPDPGAALSPVATPPSPRLDDLPADEPSEVVTAQPERAVVVPTVGVAEPLAPNPPPVGDEPPRHDHGRHHESHASAEPVVVTAPHPTPRDAPPSGTPPTTPPSGTPTTTTPTTPAADPPTSIGPPAHHPQVRGLDQFLHPQATP